MFLSRRSIEFFHRHQSFRNCLCLQNIADEFQIYRATEFRFINVSSNWFTESYNRSKGEKRNAQSEVKRFAIGQNKYFLF